MTPPCRSAGLAFPLGIAHFQGGREGNRGEGRVFRTGRSVLARTIRCATCRAGGVDLNLNTRPGGLRGRHGGHLSRPLNVEPGAHRPEARGYGGVRAGRQPAAPTQARPCSGKAWVIDLYAERASVVDGASTSQTKCASNRTWVRVLPGGVIGNTRDFGSLIPGSNPGRVVLGSGERGISASDGKARGCAIQFRPSLLPDGVQHSLPPMGGWMETGCNPSGEEAWGGSKESSS